MHFPSDMNFQYFFFNTYPGFFLQALPIALIAGIVYFIIRFFRDNDTKASIKVFSTLLICYLTGLVCLTLLFYILRDLWYWLLYHSDPGTSHPLEWTYNLSLSFRPNAETLFNLLMFLPFGILFPLACKKRSWKTTVLAGSILILTIEFLQPFFSRAFDLTDVVLNTVGVIISATLFFIAANLCSKPKGNRQTD